MIRIIFDMISPFLILKFQDSENKRTNPEFRRLFLLPPSMTPAWLNSGGCRKSVKQDVSVVGQYLFLFFLLLFYFIPLGGRESCKDIFGKESSIVSATTTRCRTMSVNNT